MTEPTGPELPVDALVDALAAAQGEFPTIAKTQTAEVRPKDGRPGYRYRYADLGDVLAAVRPILSGHGLALVQRTVRDEGKTVLVTELRHRSGGTVASEVDLGQSSGNPQAFGGSLTYLRRYELVTLLGIAAEEDTDAQHVEPAGAGQARAPELPVWAKSATRGRVAEAGPALVPVLGTARARDVVAAIRASLGHIPDVTVATIKLVANHYGAALEELGLMEDAVRERTVLEEQAAKEAAERAQAEEAQAAAEAPDAAPPEDTPDAAHRELDDAVDAAAAADVDPDVEQTRAPAPGTVDVDLAGVTEAGDAAQRLRENGCTCPDPLAAGRFEQRDEAGDTAGAAAAKTLVDDSCPIRGHGIGF